jgi:phosphomannomutase
MSDIQFDADGWKAVIADEFTFTNVKMVTQGIAAYVNSHNLNKRGIVIGYDNRFLAERFAHTCARVLVGNGVRVILLRKPTPTPVTVYAVRAREAGGAIIFTGGDTPPEYQGLKFIPEYAGPALPEATEELETEVHRALDNHKVYELSLQEAEKLELVEEYDADREYQAHIMKMLNLDAFKNGLKVVVDPMFGVGVGYLDNYLEALGCEMRAVHGYRDVLFGGSLPRPADQNLDGLKRAVKSYEADLGLALDGEASRFGVVDKNGEYVAPNQVMCLLLDYLLKTRSFRGPVARSVATTHMLDRVAKKNGLAVIETPIGFKYIGRCLRERGCMLGAEENGGLSIFGHIPDKDGILACLLVAEMAAVTGKSLTELREDFTAEYGEVANEKMDLHYGLQDQEQVMHLLNEYNPKSIAGVKVEQNQNTGGRKFVMEDGSWVLIRPANTEPVLRIYVEALDRVRLGDIQREIQNALGL